MPETNDENPTSTGRAIKIALRLNRGKYIDAYRDGNLISENQYFDRAVRNKLTGFNVCLEIRKAAYEHYKSTGEKVDSREIKRRWNAHPNWGVGSQDRLQTTTYAAQGGYDDAEAAYQNFFDSISGKRKGPKMGFPKYKSVHHVKLSFYESNNGITFGTKDSGKPGHKIIPGERRLATHVKLPILGWIRMEETVFIESVRLEGKHIKRLIYYIRRPNDSMAGRVGGAHVSVDDGRYYISFSLSYDNQIRKDRLDNKICGLDLDVHAHTIYDGASIETFPLPRALRAYEKKLRRRQRRVSRREKGGSNYKKAQKSVRRLHARIRRIRSEHTHELTTYLVRNYKEIIPDNNNVKSMMRSGLRGIPKSLADANFGEFVRQLKYKAPDYKTKITMPPKRYPSSKTCNACGHINAGLKLQDVYTCEKCGVTWQRDENAAKNLYKLKNLD